MKKTHPLLGIIAVAVLLLAGCAGNQIGSPTSPDLQTSASTGTNQQLWGFWEVSLDPASGEFETAPLRTIQFQANVTQFLQPPSAPINLLQLALDSVHSDLINGYVVCTITLKHPFPGLPKYRGFDVRGICMGNASHTGLTGDGENWADQSELRVKNADGYTRWWNPTEFTTKNTILGYTVGKLSTPGFNATGTINGYKYFADGLDTTASMDTLDLTNRGTYANSPGNNSRQYIIQFPVVGGAPQFKFNYAVTASYSDPDASGAPDYPIDSFPPSANCSEAFRIGIKDTGSTAFYNDSSNFGGSLKFDLEVYDWGLSVNSSAMAEISAITLESPTLFTGLVNVDTSSPTPGPSGTSMIYSVVLDNVTPTSLYNQEIMVRVVSANPTSYKPEIPGITGFVYPSAPLASYLLWTANIVQGGTNNPPEVGVITGPTMAMAGDNTVYHLSFANDVEDGTNLTILWDNDGDLDFADDVDGVSTDLDGTVVFPSAGNFNVIARAVDSGGLHTDSAPYAVAVKDCPTEIHSTFTPRFLVDAMQGQTSRFDMAFQTVGPYAGQMLIQANETEIRRYDVTQSGTNWTGNPYITILNGGFMRFPFHIVVEPVSGRVIVLEHGAFSGLDPREIDIYDNTGAFLKSIFIQNNRYINGIDTDENGDLWIATFQAMQNPTSTQIQHFVYQDADPYYVEETSDAVDTSAQYNENFALWDIAVSIKLHRIYVFRGNYGQLHPDMTPVAPYGEIYCYDIASDGKLTFNAGIQTQNAFAEKLGGSENDYGSLVNGDIEIDHSSLKSEPCRIILMAKSDPNIGAGMFFKVMDSNLNTIDESTVTNLGYAYYFTIRPDAISANRSLFVTAFTSGGEIFEAEAPAGY